MDTPLLTGFNLYQAYQLVYGDSNKEQNNALKQSIHSIELWFYKVRLAFNRNRPEGLSCIPSASNWIKRSVDNGNADLVYDYFKNLVEIISDTNPNLMPNAEVVEGVKSLHKIADYLIKTEYKFN